MPLIFLLVLASGCDADGPRSDDAGVGERGEDPAEGATGGSGQAPGEGEGEGASGGASAGEGEGEGEGEGQGPGGGEGGEGEDEGPTAWSEGPYGYGWWDVVGDFTFPEDGAEWRFRDHFDARDSYVFVGYADSVDYVKRLWSSNLSWLLNDTPPNVHFFFYAMPDGAGRHRVFEHMAPVTEALEAALERMDEATAAHWRARVHLADAPVTVMGGWLQEMVVERGKVLFAIDRAQRLRQLGLLGQPAQNPFVPELHYVANEVRHFNFEADRRALLATHPVLEVPLLADHAHAGGWGGGHGSRFEVDLPSAEELSSFDTAELDMHMRCADRSDDNCPEWDHTARLFVCEWPADAGGGDPSEEACEPAAEQACACGSPTLGAVERSRVCNEDGTAWSACRCGCGDELGRWITTYRREGRWVTDISPLLPMLPGGKVDMRYTSPNGQPIDLTLRLSQRGKPARPSALLPLFEGGSFRPGSNDRYTPKPFRAPEGTTRVELVTMITGHSFGHDANNCAEFCNHTHHFDLNGQAWVKDHPEAGAARGCVEQIEGGVVPNQFGTWPYGRGGWCPGLDVAPWVVDVTDSVELDGDNTISYRAMLNQREYEPRDTDGEFNPSIIMSSWLLFSR